MNKMEHIVINCFTAFASSWKSNRLGVTYAIYFLLLIMKVSKYKFSWRVTSKLVVNQQLPVVIGHCKAAQALGVDMKLVTYASNI